LLKINCQIVLLDIYGYFKINLLKKCCILLFIFGANGNKMNSHFNIIHFNIIDSTNTYAVENIKKLPHDTVVIADVQTKGRGRFERFWVSDSSENLYVSIVIKPEVSYEQLPIANFPQLFSVIVSETFLSYDVVPEIKWPNDVLVNKKKCAGILAESSFDGNLFNGIVIGIGVNIASDPSAKLDNQKVATTLMHEADHHIEKDDFLDRMLSIYIEKYKEFCERGFSAIHGTYEKYFTFIDDFVSLFNGVKHISGKVIGISESGDLVLQTASGETEKLTIGEIL